jgi:intracellular septation protein
MKIFFDLLPVIVFFVIYTLARSFPESATALAGGWLGDDVTVTQAPILIATAAVIVATALQIAALKIAGKRIGKMQWMSLALVTLFGGATLLFRDRTFIQWKLTVLYWLFAAVLAGSNAFLGRNLIKSALGTQIQIPEPVVWARLNLAWTFFFAALGVLNLYVAYTFSEAIWVSFKLFGCMALMLIFVLAQGFYLSKHMVEDECR